MTDDGWHDATSLYAVPEIGMTVLEVAGESLLLNREGTTVHCFKNACGHLGYPLDMGQVMHNTVTCPFHKHRFCLRTGQCLNMPGEQLETVIVQVVDEQVQVKLT